MATHSKGALPSDVHDQVMLPGHLAVGYLLFTILTGYRYRRSQTLGRTRRVQLPDLIDKPVAWYLQVLPNGRSLSHSGFVAVLLAGVGYGFVERYERSLVGIAFDCGYLTSLFDDGLSADPSN